MIKILSYKHTLASWKGANLYFTDDSRMGTLIGVQRRV